MNTKTQPHKFKIDWFNTIFMSFFTLMAIGFSVLHFMHEETTWGLGIAFLAFYFLTGLGITGGYHRLISHRAYKANSFVKFMYLVWGAGTFENSALKWCSDHRRHHTHCDHDEDPYNINVSFWHAHMGWILTKDKHPTLSSKYAADLKRDKLIMWQHKYYIPIAIVTGLLLPILVGYLLGAPLGGIGLLAFGRLVIVHHFTFFINSLCHVIGAQTYTDTNSAKDSWIMAIFTYGEGYHNFHHYFQADYRNGIRWFHFDPTKWLIKTLSYVGFVSELKETPEEDIIKAKLIMEKKRLSEMGLARDIRVKNMMIKIEESLSQWSELRKEYIQEKRAHHTKTMNELAVKIDQVKADVRNMLNDWQDMKKGLVLAA